jgi:type IV secretory pathway VirB10-like protein
MLGIFPNSNQKHKIGNKRKQKQGSPQIPEGSQYESGYETALEYQEHTVLRKDNYKVQKMTVIKRVLQTPLWNQIEELTQGIYVPINSADFQPTGGKKKEEQPRDYNLWRDEWVVPHNNAITVPETEVQNVATLYRLDKDGKETEVFKEPPLPETEEEKMAKKEAQKLKYKEAKQAKAKAKKEAKEKEAKEEEEKEEEKEEGDEERKKKEKHKKRRKKEKDDDEKEDNTTKEKKRKGSGNKNDFGKAGAKKTAKLG